MEKNVSEPLKIYIAAPYSASIPEEVQRNVEKAIDVGIQIWERGHYPYIPHLTHYVKARPKCTLSWNDFVEWDRPWIDACDALLYLGKSKGSDIEKEYAQSKEKQVFKSLEEIPAISRRSL